jgi:hypothetical protein
MASHIPYVVSVVDKLRERTCTSTQASSAALRRLETKTQRQLQIQVDLYSICNDLPDDRQQNRLRQVRQGHFFRHLACGAASLAGSCHDNA